ncbi:AraC family transcriptional regulator [Taibaiella chishuiensis]|uniref:AraC family transcriptional regulator n=1 Tax=Taibaiella chishuiensis TaxID=1434707 RepID=A0A2P8CXY6_9BACT|nr:helix-turn-helix domain-containing protein [Taibaiella chishuiensis]PSK89823.1 AraC family transcriptional regulator [Taibaiella chishuiensis]
MLHREFEPAEALRDAIRCFWYDKRDFGPQPTNFDVMPDGYAEIIFHFGKGCSRVSGNTVAALPSPFMVGLLNQPEVFRATQYLEILAVRCYPWTVFDLLELPSGKDSVQVFEHPVAQLQPALQQCIDTGDIDTAINLLQQFFLDARAKVAIDSMLHKAGVAMQHAGGNLPVSGVAAAAHATVRTLERNFKQSSGHTVKDVSGLMRFEQARNRLWHYPQTNLAGLAEELGYTDQSHLSREFKRYSGTTPAAFARKARQTRPLAGHDFVAFVQA